jgi:hypothetical protein
MMFMLYLFSFLMLFGNLFAADDIDALKEQIFKLQLENESYLKKLQEMGPYFKSMDNQIQQDKKKIEKLEEELLALKEIKKDLDATKGFYEQSLEEQKMQAKKVLDKALADQRLKEQESKEIINQQQDRLDEQKNEIDRLKEQMVELSKNTGSEDSIKNYDKLLEQLQEQKKVHDGLQERFSALQAQNKELQQKPQQDQEALRKEVEEASNRALQQKIQTITKEKQTLERENQELQVLLDSEKEQRKADQEKFEQEKASFESSGESLGDLGALTPDRHLNADEIASLKEEVKALEEENKRLQHSLGEQKEQEEKKDREYQDQLSNQKQKRKKLKDPLEEQRNQHQVALEREQAELKKLEDKKKSEQQDKDIRDNHVKMLKQLRDKTPRVPRHKAIAPELIKDQETEVKVVKEKTDEEREQEQKREKICYQNISRILSAIDAGKEDGSILDIKGEFDQEQRVPLKDAKQLIQQYVAEYPTILEEDRMFDKVVKNGFFGSTREDLQLSIIMEAMLYKPEAFKWLKEYKDLKAQRGIALSMSNEQKNRLLGYIDQGKIINDADINENKKRVTEFVQYLQDQNTASVVTPVTPLPKKSSSGAMGLHSKKKVDPSSSHPSSPRRTSLDEETQEALKQRIVHVREDAGINR